MKISYECKKCGEVFQDMFHTCEPYVPLNEESVGQRKKGEYMVVKLCPEDRALLDQIQKQLASLIETQATLLWFSRNRSNRGKM
jgi:hypothetical protein